MRIAASLAAVMVACAGCNQGNGDNVMAAQADALRPEQVDALLGPENQPAGDEAAANGVNGAAAADNSAETGNAANAAVFDRPAASDNATE